MAGKSTKADEFDPSRHWVEAWVNLSRELRPTIMNNVIVEKQLTTTPQPQ